MNRAETAEAVFEILAHAVAGEGERAATVLADLGQRVDADRMYGVCCAFASAGTQMLYKIFGEQPPGHMWVLEELAPGAVTADPAEGFAVRFLTAWANGDRDTTLALFETALRSEGNQYTDSVCALVAQAASLCRAAQQQPT